MKKSGPRTMLLFMLCLSFCALVCSCSINRMATRAVADFLSGSGESTVFTGEEDPELVGDALPFVLKVYESLLESDPDNAALALATGRTFTMYAYAFVQAPSDTLPAERFEEQRAMRIRAKALSMRGRQYVLAGLEKRRPGFRKAMDSGDMKAALKLCKKEDIDYLYWTGAAWLSAFSADPFDFAQIVALPQAMALLRQVEEWNEAYGEGSLQGILVSLYGAAPTDLGGSDEKARAHFDRAVELSRGLSARNYVSLATAISIKKQDKAEFTDLMRKALAVDVNANPKGRLENIIAQRKARWMLDHIDDFFL